MSFICRQRAIEFPSLRHKWVYLLKNMHKMRPIDEAKETDPIFKRLYEESRLSNLNEEEMEKYKKSVLEYQDVQDAISYASKQSEARGEARGEAKGLKKGRKAGLAEGEINAKRAMAAEMLKKGIPLGMVSEITGLSEDEIKALS